MAQGFERTGMAAAGLVALVAIIAACAGGSGGFAGGRYIDQMTCEIKNPNEGDPKYDPQCILAAQASAKAAAREAAKAAAASAKAQKK